ncbi:MAG: lytic transglycosylase domain-containing protein [Sphingomonadales bacterium]|nr:lytic transglycosylase domain-containing protein [Sphingomonadales bacterium]
MPNTSFPASATPRAGAGVRDAIARAADATGADFDYLLAEARLESSLDPSAHAGTSSAAGLYQFTGGTWLATLGKHGAEHGLSLPEGATRAQIMALRYDPQASALMAGELANDNRAALSSVLGREPDAAELYMAHFLGSGGATRFLTALAADPGQPAAALLPQAAAANRTIFFDRTGAPRSLGGVMDLMRGRMASAMGQGDMASSVSGDGPGWGLTAGSSTAWTEAPHPTAAPPEGEGLTPSGPIAREFAAAGNAVPALPSRPSMSATLAATFGLASGAASAGAPQFVRTAYGKLTAMGL